MKKIKKHWKEILLVVFVLFGLNKCTVSCNRGQQIKKLQTTILSQDTVINKQEDSIKAYTRDIEDYRNQIMMLKGFSREQMRADSLNRAQQAQQTKVMNSAIRELKRSKK